MFLLESGTITQADAAQFWLKELPPGLGWWREVYGRVDKEKTSEDPYFIVRVRKRTERQVVVQPEWVRDVSNQQDSAAFLVSLQMTHNKRGCFVLLSVQIDLTVLLRAIQSLPHDFHLNGVLMQLSLESRDIHTPSLTSDLLLEDSGKTEDSIKSWIQMTSEAFASAMFASSGNKDTRENILSYSTKSLQDLVYETNKSRTHRFRKLKQRLVNSPETVDGIEVGTLWYMYDDDSNSSVCVHLEVQPEYRRRGYARYLLSEWEREVMIAGVKTLNLHCFANNVAASTLYSNYGFLKTHLNYFI